MIRKTMTRNTVVQADIKAMQIMTISMFLALLCSNAVMAALSFSTRSSTTKRVAFVPRQPNAANNLRTTVPRLSEELVLEGNADFSPDDDTSTSNSNADAQHEKTTLTLKGDVSIASNTLPTTSDQSLSEFFKTAASRNLLVSGGGERPVDEVGMTKELLDEWKNQCTSLGAKEPNENDSILSVVSRGIQFPGLKVKSIATVGAKYVEEDKMSTAVGPTNCPRHEFVLLANNQKASGLPPMVWIYNKLTGSGNNKDGKDNSSAKSLSTVSYEKSSAGVIFRTKASLSIGITFPKLLLKILPADKATIEEKAATSVQKTLEKDLTQSMEAYEKAYLDTVASIAQ